MCGGRSMKYFLGFLACALVVSLSNGQSNSGNIQGTVSDSTGAALPKATVTVRNLDTGATVSTETTDAGLYSAPNLPPGRYALTVEAPNFKKYVREGVTVPTDLSMVSRSLWFLLIRNGIKVYQRTEYKNSRYCKAIFRLNLVSLVTASSV